MKKPPPRTHGRAMPSHMVTYCGFNTDTVKVVDHDEFDCGRCKAALKSMFDKQSTKDAIAAGVTRKKIASSLGLKFGTVLRYLRGK